MKIILKFTFLIVVFSLLNGCGFLMKSSPNESQIKNEDHTPQILTLVFEINENSIHLENSSLNIGELRKSNPKNNQTKNGDLFITFQDDHENDCLNLAIQNPLIKHVEYSDDNKNMQSKTIDVESSFFTVRVQYQDCMQNIQIEKVIDDSKNIREKMISIPLNLNAYE